MEHARPPSELLLQGSPTERAEAWRKWLRQFRVFIKASGVHKEPIDVQASLLINLIGSEGYNIYSTFKFTKDEDRDNLDKLIELFNNYFGTKTNTTMVRFKFFTRNQEVGETIDEYVTALRLMSQRCEFEQLEEGLLRDRITCGIRDGAVRDRLLRTDELTLEKAIKICQANEISNDNGRQIESVGTRNKESMGMSVDVMERDCNRWRGIRRDVRGGVSSWMQPGVMRQGQRGASGRVPSAGAGTGASGPRAIHQHRVSRQRPINY